MSPEGDVKPKPKILAATLKSVLAIGLLSVGAATWLSKSQLDKDGLARLAGAQVRGQEDPVTTGSLSRSAAGTRLDPCVLPPKR